MAVGHGIHWHLRDGRQDEPFTVDRPFGLNYTREGVLTAVYWNATAALHGNVEPEGFSGDHDVWRHHVQSCAYNWSATNEDGVVDQRYPFFIDAVTARTGIPGPTPVPTTTAAPCCVHTSRTRGW